MAWHVPPGVVSPSFFRNASQDAQLGVIATLATVPFVALTAAMAMNADSTRLLSGRA